jgi:hypothetical protein
MNMALTDDPWRLLESGVTPWTRLNIPEAENKQHFSMKGYRMQTFG